MKWLLDTNVISEGMRLRPDASVLRWIAVRRRPDLTISAMTLAELRDGADTIADVKRRAAFFQWIETEVESLFGERILEVGTDVLIDWIRLARKLKAMGRPKEPADLLIAATARVHDLILVTRNVRDFADTGIVVYDPWHDKTHRMGAP